MKNVEILNSKGEPIVLDSQQKRYVKDMQEKLNALGIEINVTTLTTIQARVVEQQFYTIPPALYVPIRVGVGAWSSSLLTLVATSVAGDFETGIINTGGNQSRLAQADTGVDSIPTPIHTWAKEINWTIADLQFAQRAGNWDVVESKEKARKKNWDLGIQQIAFLGNSTGTLTGLLNMANVTANATFLTKPIKTMNATEFAAFLGGLIPLYRINTQYTVMPDRFFIPESDFTGLGSAIDEGYGNKSRLQRMLEAFRLVTMNDDFEVLPLVYGDQRNNGLAKNRYVLMKYDDEGVNMNIPVDYTPTAAGTINNFQFSNAAYGQFSSVVAYRPATVMYFDFAGNI